MGDCPTGILIDFAELKEEKSDKNDFGSILSTPTRQKNNKMARREPPCAILVDITNKSPFKTPVRSPFKTPVRSPFKTPVRSPFKTPVRTPKKKDVASSNKAKIQWKKESPDDNDISLLENEVFDFDLKSPTAENEESDDEVFFGPVGLKESLVAHSRRLDNSELNSFESLSAKELVEVFKEATEVAVRIQSVREHRHLSSGFDIPKLTFDNLSPTRHDDSDAVDSATFTLAPLVATENRDEANISITKDTTSQTVSDIQKPDMILSPSKDDSITENNPGATTQQEDVVNSLQTTVDFDVVPCSISEVGQEESENVNSECEASLKLSPLAITNTVEYVVPTSELQSAQETASQSSPDQRLDSVEKVLEAEDHCKKLNGSFCPNEPAEDEGNIILEGTPDRVSEESSKRKSVSRRSNGIINGSAKDEGNISLEGNPDRTLKEPSKRKSFNRRSTGIIESCLNRDEKAQKKMTKHTSSPVLFRVPKSKISKSSTPRIERSSTSKNSNSPNLSLIDSSNNEHGGAFGTPGHNNQSSRIPFGNPHSRIPSLNSSQLSSRSSQEKNTSSDSLCSEYSYSSSESSFSGSKTGIPQIKPSGLHGMTSRLRKPVHHSSIPSSSSIESHASEKRAGTSLNKLQSLPSANIHKPSKINKPAPKNSKAPNGPMKAFGTSGTTEPAPKVQSIRRSQRLNLHMENNGDQTSPWKHSLNEKTRNGRQTPIQQSTDSSRKAGTPKIKRTTSFTPTQQKFIKPALPAVSKTNFISTPSKVCSSVTSNSTPRRLGKGTRECVALPKGDTKAVKLETTTRKGLPTPKTSTKPDSHRSEASSLKAPNK